MSENGSGRKWQSYALLGVSGLLALALFGSGVTKLIGMEMHVANFAKWGYPSWFMYFTGIFEIVVAVGLLLKRYAFYAAVLVMIQMVAAFATHMMNDEAAMTPGAIVLFIVAGFIAYGRRGDKAQAS
jgi:putative oxidoreductase